MWLGVCSGLGCLSTSGPVFEMVLDISLHVLLMSEMVFERSSTGGFSI
jgi:hypothetical protein